MIVPAMAIPSVPPRFRTKLLGSVPMVLNSLALGIILAEGCDKCHVLSFNAGLHSDQCAEIRMSVMSSLKLTPRAYIRLESISNSHSRQNPVSNLLSEPRGFVKSREQTKTDGPYSKTE